MRIFGYTIMKTTAYEAEIADALDLAASVARIGEKIALRDDEAAERQYGLPPRTLTARRHRRAGGHLHLVTDSTEPCRPVEPGDVA